MNFNSRAAVVTGGGSGIGEATALALAHQMVSIVVADVNIDNAKRVAGQIEQAGGKATAIRIDVSNADSIERAFSLAEDWNGGAVDILVNSAGIMGVKPILAYPIDEWERVMSVNVTGSFLCAKRAGKGMVAQKYGRIINVASISAARAGIGRAAYGTSKAAVVGLTRQLAIELGPHGVTANALAPGPVVTAMTESSYNTQTVNAYTSMIPARRLGTVEEMADAILFLASETAGFVNGVMLPVDGGYLAAGVMKTGDLEED
ncbi:SDR family NAD(P)-dependent oxidoreductase [Paraburkholderia sp. RL17-347-BIC-D]|uniref:SDR family NAD(P)-dependent oxidoreductase n=1 Tax=Paraburkholderia sp. RL17-347-BIC-D TaxID=3031632 RepID=UPI0038B72733